MPIKLRLLTYLLEILFKGLETESSANKLRK